MTKLDKSKARHASTISGTVQLPPVHTEEIIQALREEIEALKNENEALRTQIADTLVVKLISEWTDGTLTKYNHPYDVMTKNGTRVEVKYSKVNVQNSTKTQRWNWDSILGRNEMKQFDYLVLAGSRNPSYEYPDLPFVFFVVPRSAANDVMTDGNCIALNTNLNKVRAPKSVALKAYLVRSQSEFERFKYPTPPVLESANAKTTATPT